MSWFEEQLQARERSDNISLSESIDCIAGAVMGNHLSEAVSDRERTSSAIEEILRYFRIRSRQEDLPDSIVTAEELLEYRMRPLGIMYRSVELEPGWYHTAVGPMLGTLKESGTLIALIPGRFSGYHYTDPVTGKRVTMNRKTEGLILAEATCFYEPMPLKSMTKRDLLKFMVSQLSGADSLLLLGLLALSTLLGLLSPVFTKMLLGPVLESGSVRILGALAAFMLCYAIGNVMFHTFKDLMNARIGTKLNVTVQAAMMGRIMSLPATFFRRYSSGDLTRRFSYMQEMCMTIFGTVGTTVLTSLFSLVYLAQVMKLAPALTIPAMVITGSMILVTVLTTVAQIKDTEALMHASAVTGGMTYATITGIQKIKLAGAETRMLSRWARQYAREAKCRYSPVLLLKLGETLNLTVTLLGTLLLYWQAIRHDVAVADYYAFNASYGMVSSAFMSLISAISTLASIGPALEMADPILEEVPELSEGKELVTELTGAIELNHVSFRYAPDLPYVIDDLSMKIRPGEYVAVTGVTGSGKSTLLRLLLGFEKPQKGSIFYDRHDLNHVDTDYLRRMIGVVMQDDRLFAGDIYSNIVISVPELNMDGAWEAAELACIAEDIRRMPMGMNTYVTEGQGGISGGQRQRLIIARALAPRPKILMFDEATSALDNVTQKKISEAIDGLKCTRVVIAHRLSTVRNADRILYLEDGRIAEEGTYDELMAANGKFAALVERQRL